VYIKEQTGLDQTGFVNYLVSMTKVSSWNHSKSMLLKKSGKLQKEVQLYAEALILRNSSKKYVNVK